MRALDILDTALRALTANKVRTVLTSLGITIGIAAVITMVSAGQGAQSKLDAALGNIGPNLVVATSGSRTKSGLWVGPRDGAFTREDAEAVRRFLSPYINGCSEVNQLPCEASTTGVSYVTALAGGVPEVFRIRRWTLAAGRFYSEEDNKRQDKVALIGATVAQKLFPNLTPQQLLGKEIRINRTHRFEIIGVLEPKGTSIIGADQDDLVMVPINTLLRRVMGTDAIRLVVAEAREIELVPILRDKMELLLMARRGIKPNEDKDFEVNSIREMASLAEIFTATLSALVFAIASVSLLVAGIGVMNIMLVSVTERTREIGIRMAIGAKTADIRNQFLTEAVILSLIGGFTGITLGASCAVGISYLLDWDLVISPTSILVAVAVSTGVGIFFGYYPATKASQLDPIDALRYE